MSYLDHKQVLVRSAVCLLSDVCLLFTKSHLEASNTKTAKGKDVWNENLEFFRWSAVCLLSAVCSLHSNKPLRGSNTKNAQSKVVCNENLEFLR